MQQDSIITAFIIFITITLTIMTFIILTQSRCSLSPPPAASSAQERYERERFRVEPGRYPQFLNPDIIGMYHREKYPQP